MMEAYFTDGTAVPIHTIFCIGRNYAEHARELGGTVPTSPVVFTKPDTTIIHNGDRIMLPMVSEDVQHEVELVVLMGAGGKHIRQAEALNCVAGYGVGIDVTARDIQRQAMKEGEPWLISKGFDTFAPISDFVPSEDVGDPQALSLELSVNGAVRQRGDTRDMVFSVARLITHLSTIFTLQRGDVILTGTPEGVARLRPGDVVNARLSPALTQLEVTVAKA